MGWTGWKRMQTRRGGGGGGGGAADLGRRSRLTVTPGGRHVSGRAVWPSGRGGEKVYIVGLAAAPRAPPQR